MWTKTPFRFADEDWDCHLLPGSPDGRFSCRGSLLRYSEGCLGGALVLMVGFAGPMCFDARDYRDRLLGLQYGLYGVVFLVLAVLSFLLAFGVKGAWAKGRWWVCALFALSVVFGVGVDVVLWYFGPLFMLALVTGGFLAALSLVDGCLSSDPVPDLSADATVVPAMGDGSRVAPDTASVVGTAPEPATVAASKSGPARVGASAHGGRAGCVMRFDDELDGAQNVGGGAWDDGMPRRGRCGIFGFAFVFVGMMLFLVGGAGFLWMVATMWMSGVYDAGVAYMFAGLGCFVQGFLVLPAGRCFQSLSDGPRSSTYGRLGGLAWSAGIASVVSFVVVACMPPAQVLCVFELGGCFVLACWLDVRNHLVVDDDDQ